MENKINTQLELFAEGKGAGVKSSPANNMFLTRFRNYEKGILIIMGMIVTGIISFSLGMERGKSIGLSKAGVAPITEPKARVFEEKIKDKKVLPEENITIKDTAPAESQYYVIQLASFKNKTLAEKEAMQLKKKGFASLVLSKGVYSVLCVGNFSNKQAAASSQVELKKQYKDCYIRRL